MIAVDKQRGFTLLELLISTMVIGVLATFVINPIFQQTMSATKRSYQAEQRIINQRLGAALLSYAEQQSVVGELPIPYTGAPDLVSAVLDPSDAALEAHLLKTVHGPAINSDGRAARNVRVYQVANGLTETLRLNGSSGPAVEVLYEYAVIHLTRCQQDNSCNAGTVPGESDPLTPANYATYEIHEDEIGAYHFSTLPLQQKKLNRTAQNLNEVVARLMDAKAALEESNAIDGTNYLLKSTVAAAPDLAGTNPTSNQGCHDGWYNLEAGDINILAQLGLSQDEYSTTDWGGRIEYCRDYEPAAVNSDNADTPPHYGAVRIHKDVSLGLAPDSGFAGNNIYLTF